MEFELLIRVGQRALWREALAGGVCVGMNLVHEHTSSRPCALSNLCGYFPFKAF